MTFRKVFRWQTTSSRSYPSICTHFLWLTSLNPKWWSQRTAVRSEIDRGKCGGRWLGCAEGTPIQSSNISCGENSSSLKLSWGSSLVEIWVISWCICRNEAHFGCLGFLLSLPIPRAWRWSLGGSREGWGGCEGKNRGGRGGRSRRRNGGKNVGAGWHRRSRRLRLLRSHRLFDLRSLTLPRRRSSRSRKSSLGCPSGSRNLGIRHISTEKVVRCQLNRKLTPSSRPINGHAPAVRGNVMRYYGNCANTALWLVGFHTWPNLSGQKWKNCFGNSWCISFILPHTSQSVKNWSSACIIVPNHMHFYKVQISCKCLQLLNWNLFHNIVD